MTIHPDTTHSFRHQRFIEPASLHRTFASWLPGPLIVCLTPVMIGALFLALQGQLIAAFLKAGTALAVLCAAGWTLLQMARTPALVTFRNERVLIKTFLEASVRPHLEKWHYVIDVRKSNRRAIDSDPAPASVTITYGHTTYEFRENDWDDFHSLTLRLKEAKQHYEEKVRAAVT